MLWLVAALGVVFALMSSIGPLGAFALGLFLLGVLAHVVGNALGTRLREIGDEPQAPAEGARPRETLIEKHEFAPATRLARRHSLGWWLPATLVVGFLAGAVGGGMLLAGAYGQHATPTRLAIGGGAFGLIGAFFGFLIGAFLQVLALALWEALRGGRAVKGKRDASRQTE
jgi:hypothetical protein